jgi:tRNA (guanosine-2'-O-)-methyltransferase
MEHKITQKQIIEYLETFATENKRALIRKILPNRSRHLSIVLEDIYQPQNASAVLRTAECFGVQDVHIIENKNKYRLNPDVALGASKWISMHKYNELDINNTKTCISKLKAEGYRVVATSPHERGYTLENLPVDQKIALMFGTEQDGLTDTALNEADDYVMIPMYGFTESFNISVSAALSIHFLMNKIRQSGIDWRLKENEANAVNIDWLKQIVKNSDVLIAEFKKNEKDTK